VRVRRGDHQGKGCRERVVTADRLGAGSTEQGDELLKNCRSRPVHLGKDHNSRKQKKYRDRDMKPSSPLRDDAIGKSRMRRRLKGARSSTAAQRDRRGGTIQRRRLSARGGINKGLGAKGEGDNCQAVTMKKKVQR